jgi:p-cumate 2,3-dioxygenase alpha subunit
MTNLAGQDELTMGAAARSRWVMEDVDRGRFMVARSAFIDPEVLKRERDEIFSKCWLYLGHASELADPNDFLTRSVGGRELIFNRDRKGVYRVFFNTCPHRGATVVREPVGNALGFKCFYHGWAFNNNGVFSTRYTPGNYAPDHNSDGCQNLKAVAHLDNHRGFYFVNFDKGAGSLSDYLADAKEYLDLVSDHSDAGVEIIGKAQEYSMRANWKLLVENSYDGLHALETHKTYFEYLMAEVGAINSVFTPSGGAADFTVRDLGNGHAVIESPGPWGRPVAQWIPAWGEEGKVYIDSIRKRLVDSHGPDRAKRIAEKGRNMVIFPNLVINDIMAVTVRTFYPESPDFMNVNGWALGTKDEAPTFRKWRLNNFLEFLGPGGFATPDDNEALEACQKGYRNMREVAWNDVSKGMLKPSPAGDDEAQMRAFWREWQRRVGVANARQ